MVFAQEVARDRVFSHYEHVAATQASTLDLDTWPHRKLERGHVEPREAPRRELRRRALI
jgi:hypothetical protein